MGRGTGILPFLDFASLAIRLILFKISKEKFNYDKNKIDNESFDDIDKDFKLVLYASYYNEESSTMNKMLKDASDLSFKYNLNVFEYKVKYEKEIKNEIEESLNYNENKWNSYNFRKKFGEKNQEIKKILISGTIGFMEIMQNEFKKSDICVEENIICI